LAIQQQEQSVIDTAEQASEMRNGGLPNQGKLHRKTQSVSPSSLLSQPPLYDRSSQYSHKQMEEILKPTVPSINRFGGNYSSLDDPVKEDSTSSVYTTEN
jgi:hypothetical protein